jgi:molybdenum cofactor cytidylyltransferase
MTGLIILAAGESSRLGQPKQNLLFQNKTLLQHTIETGLHSKCRPVIVVLGANVDIIAPHVPTEDVRVIYNKDWKGGIASSIRIAMEAIEKYNSLSNVLIMLCDQPFVNTNLINNMLQKRMDTQSAIVACSYNDTIGVPALFDKTLFPKLLFLTGNEGAKTIIKNYSGDIALIPFDLGGFDIDTNADYQQLINLKD